MDIADVIRQLGPVSELKKKLTDAMEVQQLAAQLGLGNIDLAGSPSTNPIQSLLRSMGLGGAPGGENIGLANGQMQSAPPSMPGMTSGGIPQAPTPDIGGAALAGLRQYGGGGGGLG